MGQTSLPALNRSGIFSYWNGAWDSQYNYAFFLTRFSFFELFFLNFFKSSIFFLNFLTLKKGVKNTSVFFFKNFKCKAYLLDFKKKLTKHFFCSSKLWVVKFSGWVILSIYIYDPALNLRKFQNKKNNKKYRKIIQKYLKLFILKKNRHIFKNFLKKGWKVKKFFFKKIRVRLRHFLTNKFFNITQIYENFNTFKFKKKTQIITLNKHVKRNKTVNKYYFKKNIFANNWFKSKNPGKFFLNRNNFLEKKSYFFKQTNNLKYCNF